MHQTNKCECPMMPRIERLEHHMFGERASNTPGIHPIMFGDGADKGGIVQDIRDIKWYGKLGLWVITIIGGAILVTLGNLLAAKMAGNNSGGGSTNTQSVTVQADDDTVLKPGTYTTAQLAAKLQLSTREIQDRAMRGEIPGAWKDGRAWRFDQPSIDSWLAATAATAANTARAVTADQN